MWNLIYDTGCLRREHVHLPARPQAREGASSGTELAHTSILDVLAYKSVRNLMFVVQASPSLDLLRQPQLLRDPASASVLTYSGKENGSIAFTATAGPPTHSKQAFSQAPLTNTAAYNSPAIPATTAESDMKRGSEPKRSGPEPTLSNPALQLVFHGRHFHSLTF